MITAFHRWGRRNTGGYLRDSPQMPPEPWSPAPPLCSQSDQQPSLNPGQISRGPHLDLQHLCHVVRRSQCGKDTVLMKPWLQPLLLAPVAHRKGCDNLPPPGAQPTQAEGSIVRRVQSSDAQFTL